MKSSWKFMQTVKHLPTTASVKLHALYEFKKNRSYLNWRKTDRMAITSKHNPILPKTCPFLLSVSDIFEDNGFLQPYMCTRFQFNTDIIVIQPGDFIGHPMKLLAWPKKTQKGKKQINLQAGSSKGPTLNLFEASVSWELHTVPSIQTEK